MKDILISKFTQVEECHEGLKQSFHDKKRLVEAVPTSDKWWGSSMDKYQTLHTDPYHWPGKNNLGRLLEEIRDEFFQDWSEYEPENAANNIEEPTTHIQNTDTDENLINNDSKGEMCSTELAEGQCSEMKDIPASGDDPPPTVIPSVVLDDTCISDQNDGVNSCNVPTEETLTSRKCLKAAEKISGVRRTRSKSPKNGQNRSPRSNSVKRKGSTDSKVPVKQVKVSSGNQSPNKNGQKTQIPLISNGREFAGSSNVK